MGDLNQSWSDIFSKVDALKTYKDASSAQSLLKSKAGGSESQGLNEIASQLSSIEKDKKRYSRNDQTSMDKLLSLSSTMNGSGNSTLKYIRKKIIEASLKLEPIAAEIVSQEALKAIGCSQEQTFNGVSASTYNPSTINLLPKDLGVYLPVKFLDIFNNLKNETESDIGKIFYEKQKPSTDTKFKPYGGKIPYPMNKALREILNPGNETRSFGSVYGKVYNGVSEQNLLDVVYTNQDAYGVTGDYFRVILINKENSPTNDQGLKLNKVGQFLKDYYGTIKLVDNVNITASIVNLLTGAIDVKLKVGFGELNQNKKFFILLQRILGLCFDDRREIDVSGNAKVAELDGVDESFWELNEIDLRNIDLSISENQNGIVEFEGCEGIKLPIESESLVQQLQELRETFNDSNIEENTAKIESIIDSISNNPKWNNLVPKSLNVGVAIDKNFIKKLPLAVVASILTPKVVLPIFAILFELEKTKRNDINKGLDLINSGITGYNSFNNPTDFLKKFKQFSIQVTSRINEQFLKILFEIIKRDIINLLNSVVKDLNKNSASKKYAIIIRLIQIALIVIPAIGDYKRCKSLVDDILKLLSLINFPKVSIPISLLSLSALLPGESPIRSSINAFENLQKLGMPTGDLPDGSPNLMNQLILAMNNGSDKEKSENGKTQVAVILPPPFGLTVGYGKSI